jgi:lysophospholipase L1-like esterase
MKTIKLLRTAMLAIAVALSQIAWAGEPTTVMYHQALNSGNRPSDIVIPEGAASYKAAGLSVTKPGELVKLDRYYSLAERTVRYVARFSEDAVALFTSNSQDFTAFVDMPRQKWGIKLSIGRRNYINREKSIALDPTHEYLVEITRYYSTMTAVLTDLYTGEEARIQVTNDGSGGAGPGVVNSGQRVGLLHDYYCFGLDSGSEMTVSQMTVTARQCGYTLLIYGDSITEPDDYYPADIFDKTWVRLIIDNVPGKAAASGRGGTQINEILLRIKNELPYVQSKYVMVTIGTNDGNTEENLSELVEYIISQGSIPILNNIPSNEHNSQVEVNAVIEKIRQKYGLKGARFDIPTSLAHDGKEVDESTMWVEEYGFGSYRHHPNVKGARLMYLQTLVDVPEIYE